MPIGHVEVSVVLPVRNGAATIDRQLRALSRSRTERAWELIVSDNGSTDDTVARVLAWRDRLPALRVVDSGELPGAAHARNVGVAASSGSVILHCDDDDAVHPDWLERLSAATEGADLVGGSLDLLELNPARWFGCGPGDHIIKPSLRGPYHEAAGANLGYRRALFDAIGGFDPSFGPGVAEDTEFCWRAQAQGFSFAAIPAAIVSRGERTSLRSLARQHFAYGRGARQLERRFASDVLPGTNRAVARWSNALSFLLRSHRVAFRREFVRRTAFRVGTHMASRRDRPPLPLSAVAPGALSSGKPLVTAGFTAFDAVHTIERAVRSAAAQTWEPLEIVVIDDASADGTSEVLSALSTEIRQLRVVRHDHNRGVGAARETVIREARGEFVAFFDDDDASHPERIARQVARILQHEGRFGTDHPVLCNTERMVVASDGRSTRLGVAGADPLEPGVHAHDIRTHLLEGRPLRGQPVGAGPTCTQLGRRRVYEQLGGFDPAFRRVEDAELNVRLAAAGGRLIGVAEPLVEQHLTTGPDKGAAADGAAELALLAKHRDLFPSSAAYAASRRWVLARTAVRQGRRRAAAQHLTVAWIVQPLAVTRRTVWIARRHLGSLTRSDKRR